jgi:hypothetical protein
VHSAPLRRTVHLLHRLQSSSTCSEAISIIASPVPANGLRMAVGQESAAWPMFLLGQSTCLAKHNWNPFPPPRRDGEVTVDTEGAGAVLQSHELCRFVSPSRSRMATRAGQGDMQRFPRAAALGDFSHRFSRALMPAAAPSCSLAQPSPALLAPASTPQ